MRNKKHIMYADANFFVKTFRGKKCQHHDAIWTLGRFRENKRTRQDINTSSSQNHHLHWAIKNTARSYGKIETSLEPLVDVVWGNRGCMSATPRLTSPDLVAVVDYMAISDGCRRNSGQRKDSLTVVITCPSEHRDKRSLIQWLFLKIPNGGPLFDNHTVCAFKLAKVEQTAYLETEAIDTLN